MRNLDTEDCSQTRGAGAERAGTISKPDASKSTEDCFMCRSARVTVLMIVVAATVASGDQQPLTSDEIAVYQAFLKDYDNGSTAIVNLASITTPLELTENDRKTCLKGMKLDLRPELTRHRMLNAEVVAGRKVRLVDAEKQRNATRKNDPGTAIGKGKSVAEAVGTAFASGLLELSSLSFDDTHRFAVMTFSFSCGGLCGHGGTVAFEKIGQKWKRAARPCTFWMAQGKYTDRRTEYWKIRDHGDEGS